MALAKTRAWIKEAACAAPENLPLVDASIDEPGSRRGKALREHVCPTCPVWRECLDEAMDSPLWGTWGGTTAYQRTEHGGPSASRALANQRLTGGHHVMTGG